MSKKRIAVVRRLPQPLLDALAPHGELIVAPGEAGLDREALRGLMADADAALITALDGVDAELIDACPKLRLIANIGAGYNNIDIAACAARGITVTNTPGAMDDAVADLVFGLMLAVARRLPQADAFVRAGKWAPDAPNAFGMGMDVSRKTLGIIGFGRIGRVIARRALGFEMKVIYHDQARAGPAVEATLNARLTSFDDVLAQSDFVVLQVPYIPATHHLIGATQLAKMKKSAFLINAARGGVVDDAALAAALGNGTIAGAGVDCVENEPAVHPGLLTLPNVVLAPHIGSATPATRTNMAMLAVRNLIMGINGQTPPNVVGG